MEITADTIADLIREFDGDHSMGAGELGQKIYWRLEHPLADIARDNYEFGLYKGYAAGYAKAKEDSPIVNFTINGTFTNEDIDNIYKIIEDARRKAKENES